MHRVDTLEHGRLHVVSSERSGFDTLGFPHGEPGVSKDERTPALTRLTFKGGGWGINRQEREKKGTHLVFEEAVDGPRVALGDDPLVDPEHHPLLHNGRGELDFLGQIRQAPGLLSMFAIVNNFVSVTVAVVVNVLFFVGVAVVGCNLLLCLLLAMTTVMMEVGVGAEQTGRIANGWTRKKAETHDCAPKNDGFGLCLKNNRSRGGHYRHKSHDFRRRREFDAGESERSGVLPR